MVESLVVGITPADSAGTFGTSGTLNNEHPNAHDYDMHTNVYAHHNSTSGVGGKPGKSNQNRSEVAVAVALN